MAQLIFLNERSHPPDDMHPEVAGQSLADLVDVLLRIKAVLPQLALISAEPLATLRLGKDYSVASWLNRQGKNRERTRFLLSLAQQAPFQVVRELFGDPDPGVTVYRLGSEDVQGIGLAHLYGGLPVSFSHDVQWRVDSILLNVDQLVEGGENSWSVDIPHASLIEHVETHRIWLTSLRRRDIHNASDLWARRSDLFHHLDFGPDVRVGISKLEKRAFLQVVNYLCRLDDAIGLWDPSSRQIPEYPPNTSDESASRKHLCEFPAPWGGIASFTWHGRYTPGAGRIHV